MRQKVTTAYHVPRSAQALIAAAIIAPALWLSVAGAEPTTPPAGATQPAPKIIIKVDDLVAGPGRAAVHPRWQRFADFIKERKIKAGIGIICNSLETDNAPYFNWIKDLHKTGLVEFWNHGYDHKMWKEGDRTLFEFKGTSYEYQKEHLARGNQLARQKLGITLHAFGPGFNATDENTVRALGGDPDINAWLYAGSDDKSTKALQSKVAILDLLGDVNIEYPTFVPNFERFGDGYLRHRATRRYFVIQGHPTHWDDDRFAQFVKIIDFLTAEGATFATPSEVASSEMTQ